MGIGFKGKIRKHTCNFLGSTEVLSVLHVVASFMRLRTYCRTGDYSDSLDILSSVARLRTFNPESVQHFLGLRCPPNCPGARMLRGSRVEMSENKLGYLLIMQREKLVHHTINGHPISAVSGRRC